MAEDGNHVVLYMGDNLNDFLTDFAGLGVEERFAVTDSYMADFGSKFIVMPNPMYGEWELALFDYDFSSTSADKDAARKALLDTWDYSVD
jgi:predicted secreted acid phosphatase